MQQKRAFITIILLIGLLTAAGSLLINVVSGAIVMSPWVAWPLLIVVIFAGIGLAVWQYLLQSETDRAKGSVNHQNRQWLLARVRFFWIKGVLEPSLHGATLIAPGLQEKPDVLADPWQSVLQQSNRSRRSFPPGTHITEVYDDAGGELLILGESGSGKTTLLLALARDLLDRAEQKDDLPMPVVFNLSSWVMKRQPLKEWLIEGLYDIYQVPRLLGRSWVEADAVLPLLDGLDEVSPNYREQCVETINAYRREHMIPLVVCSQSAAYLEQKVRLLLHPAISVQPLTAQQIDTYISGAERQLAPLRVALRDDPTLQELATTPLTLSMLASAYQGTPVEDLSKASTLEGRRQQVFEAHVQYLIQRLSATKHYTSQQTTHWLAWLARQMQNHHLTEFYLEQMRIHWLSSARSQRIYRIVTSLGIGLVAGLVGALAGEIIGGQIARLGGGLTFGLTCWFVSWHMMEPTLKSDIGLDMWLEIDKSETYADVRPNQGLRRFVRLSLFLGLTWLLVCLLIGWLFKILAFGLALGLSLGLLFALAGGGFYCIHYIILRLFLWLTGCTPYALDYIDFLNCATERDLLYRVGRGYIFRHETWRDYFASLETHK